MHRVGGADVGHIDMTSGNHEFGARFVEKLQMRGERTARTFNDMRQELDEYDLFSGDHNGSPCKD